MVRNTIHHVILLCVIYMSLLPNIGYAQSLNAPEYVNANENFTISFEIEGEEISNNASALSLEFYTTPRIEIKEGPKISKQTNLSIINGKSSASYITTFTYVAAAVESGPFVVDSILFNHPIEPSTEIKIATSTQHSIDSVSTSSSKDSKAISSIGRRTDNLDVHKYNSKSGIVSNITGWCYNVLTDKWSGNKGFIHSTKGASSPAVGSPVCYSLQMCDYFDNNEHYYVLKWKDASVLGESRYNHIILDETQYNAFCDVNEKGVMEQVRYKRNLQPAADNQEIKEMFHMSFLGLFAARLDEGDVIRFNFDQNSGQISKNEDGIIDFSVESNDVTMQGYFEVSLANWSILFKR